MNPRRVIYIVVSLVLLVIIGYMFEGGKMPTGLEKELILNDFVDIRDNEIPEGTMGGSFYVTNVCFPSDFVGKEGDLFYVLLEDGHVGMTQKYTIKAAEKDGEKHLTYELTENFEDFTLPPGKFINYEYQGGKYHLIED